MKRTQFYLVSALMALALVGGLGVQSAAAESAEPRGDSCLIVDGGNVFFISKCPTVTGPLCVWINGVINDCF